MPIAYDVLDAQLTAAVETYLRQLLSHVDLQDLYAVGLYTSGELSYLVPTANTHSALETSKGSPWSPPDWALHLYGGEAFEHIEEALAAGWTPDFEAFEMDEGRVRAMVHKILRSARQRHFGGTEIVLGLFMGGMDHPWVKTSVEAINPPEVVQRFTAGLLPRTVLGRHQQ